MQLQQMGPLIAMSKLQVQDVNTTWNLKLYLYSKYNTTSYSESNWTQAICDNAVCKS